MRAVVRGVHTEAALAVDPRVWTRERRPLRRVGLRSDVVVRVGFAADDELRGGRVEKLALRRAWYGRPVGSVVRLAPEHAPGEKPRLGRQVVAARRVLPRIRFVVVGLGIRVRQAVRGSGVVDDHFGPRRAFVDGLPEATEEAAPKPRLPAED